MNTCIYCGAQLVANADFCGLCGKFMPSTHPASGGNPVQPTMVAPDAFTAISSPQLNPLAPQGPDAFTAFNSQQFGPVTPGANSDALTALSTSGFNYSVQPQQPFPQPQQAFPQTPQPPGSAQYATVQMPADKNQLSEDEDEDEDEAQQRIRRAMLISSSMLIGDALVRGQSGAIPTVDGSPSLGNIPSVDGTPQLDAAPLAQNPNFFQNSAVAPHPAPGTGLETQLGPSTTSQPWSWSAPSPAPSSSPVDPGMGGDPFGGPGPSMPQPGGSTGSAPGCLKIVALILVPIIILGSLASIFLVVFGPSLSLSGGSLVNPGGTFQIRGKGFFPGNTITLTLDEKIPLNVASQPAHLAQNAPFQTIILSTRLANASNTLKTTNDGSFTVDITAAQDWALGRHTIRASEAFSPRSASATFTIVEGSNLTPIPETTVTPTATTEATPENTPTDTPATPEITPGVTPTTIVDPTLPPTPTPTPTATPVTPALSKITPGTLSLGPVDEKSGKSSSGSIKIETTGSGNISWTANWNKTQNSWLQLSATSGTIATPGSQTITASAQVGNLAPGTYNATVTFSGGGKNINMNVSFTVQAVSVDCIRTSTGSLRYTVTKGGKDPAGQGIRLTNCGTAGSWSVSVSGNVPGMRASKTSGQLAANASDTITIGIPGAGGRNVGTYTGKLTFTRGGDTVVVNVTLVVQAAPPPSPTQSEPTPTPTPTQEETPIITRVFELTIN